MKPDVILSWPVSCDYPLFRQFLHDNREQFGKIIVVFTETHQKPDYKEWLFGALNADGIICFVSRQITGNEDWRNVAVNEGLRHSDSEWVLFLEQDFIVKSDGFFAAIEMMTEHFDVINVKQEARIHPCFLLIKRSLLDSLHKDFSAHPPEYDHFGAIQKQLEEKEEMVGVVPQHLYLHLNGLSHNWRLIQDRQEPNYRPEQFKLWITESLKVSVPVNEVWKNVAKRFLGLTWD